MAALSLVSLQRRGGGGVGRARRGRGGRGGREGGGERAVESGDTASIAGCGALTVTMQRYSCGGKQRCCYEVIRVHRSTLRTPQASEMGQLYCSKHLVASVSVRLRTEVRLQTSDCDVMVARGVRRRAEVRRQCEWRRICDDESLAGVLHCARSLKNMQL